MASCAAAAEEATTMGTRPSRRSVTGPCVPAIARSVRWGSDPTRSGRWPTRGKPGGEGGKLLRPPPWERVDFLPVEKKNTRERRAMGSSARNGERSMLAAETFRSFPFRSVFVPIKWQTYLHKPTSVE